MHTIIPQSVLFVVKKIQQAGFEVYPVGGCVRDSLLTRPVKDWDLTTNAKPSQVVKLFEKVIPTGIDHGTVTVLQAGEPIEVTTYRGEVGYSDGRHPDRIVFLDSLEEDLKRRDFTINAMAYDVVRRCVIDPFGGQSDLNQKQIRAVGKALERFCEDGLRAMRAVRFAAVLGFEIEAATFSAISQSIDVFRKVAQERIREELTKMLASQRPAHGIELMRTSDLLTHVIPELLLGVGHSQNRYHSRDVYQHAVRSLEKSKGDAILRLAILLHDVGKPQSAEGPAGEHTFYGHETRGAEIADAMMRRLCFSNQDRLRATNLIRNHMFHYEDTWTDGAVRRLIRRIGLENLDDMWEIRRADAWGRGQGLHQVLHNLRLLKARVQVILEAEAALKITDLAIGGVDVMQTLGISSGPLVGQALEYLLELVLDDPSLNTASKLTALLREHPEFAG